MIREIWKDILGYEGYYQASNFGKIKRLKGEIFVIDPKQNRKYYKNINEKIINYHIDSNGYKMVNLHIDNSKKVERKRVHRIIAETFIPNLENKPCVNHIDGNKENNCVSNLEWVSYSENTRHAIEMGLVDFENFGKTCKKKKRKVLMMNDNFEIIKSFDYITDAFKYFGLKYRGCITECCQGKRKHFNGYRWKYVDEE